MAERAQALVLDCGSGVCKVGFAGADFPLAFPSLIGQRKDLNANELTPTLVGNEADEKGEQYDLRYPIQRGEVTNWDDIEMLWRHCFTTAGVSAEEYPIFLADPTMGDRAAREKSIQIMFESLQVPAYYTQSTAVLSLYCMGRLTGCVLESGHGQTWAVPIVEGKALTQQSVKASFGGVDLTNYMADLLAPRGLGFNSHADRHTTRDIKEKLCYVALNFEEEVQHMAERDADLLNNRHQDSQFPQFGSERFRCPEALFQPHLINATAPGIHQMIHNSITQCDDAVRAALYSNVCLSGGNTLFEGISERVSKELTELAPAGTRIKVVAPPGRNLNSWIGGSILGSLDSFLPMLISKAEYEEAGPSIVHRKCT